MTDDPWSKVRSELEATLGKAAFRNWIEPLDFDGVSQGIGRFRVATSFMGTWVSRNYGEMIRDRFCAAGARIERLEFVARPSDPAARLADKTAESAAISLQTSSPTSAGSRAPALRPSAPHQDEAESRHSAPLNASYTFDSFVVGKPNEMAHAAARRVADLDEVSFNPLFLHGGVGLGKTHLMHAIASRVRERDPDRRVLYLSAEQFTTRFVQAIRFGETYRFKELFRSVDMLLVDDVQFFTGKGSTQEEFFHTFNALVENRSQVVISADRAPGEIDGIEERIRSRLQWGLVVDLHPTDYELRLGILQSKAEAMLRGQPDIEMDPKVLEFIAHRVSSNVRVLEGALNRLIAFAALVGRAITLDMAQDCLADTLRASERKVTVDEIIRKVADHYNLRMSELLGARRARAVARPRQIAMYLAKKLTTRSLPEIGRSFGGRDHSTVIHAVRRVEELMGVDHQVADDLEMLRRMLEA